MGISATGREMMNGRKCGASFGIVIGLSCVRRGTGRQSHHRLSCWGVLWLSSTQEKKTTNAIYVTDSQGIPLAMSTPVSGSHNDVYNIPEALSELFSELKSSALPVSGLCLNADAVFDTEQFRRRYHEHVVFPYVAFNKRLGKQGEENS